MKHADSRVKKSQGRGNKSNDNVKTINYAVGDYHREQAALSNTNNTSLE